VLGEPSVIELKAGIKPTVLLSPNGTLDLGSIELHRKPSGSILIVTEWFELTAEAKSLSVSMIGNDR
jgi:hypothetical protein